MIYRHPSQTITQAGGNLFRVAAERLGDASQWYRVALASDRTDPWLEGLVTLNIPVRLPSGGNGGILGPI